MGSSPKCASSDVGLVNTHPQTVRRRLAGAVMSYAARVMPSDQREWAEAMRNELPSVADDGEALQWAIGCLSAAHVARLRGLHLLDVAAVRVVGVIVAAFRAFDVLLPTVLTAAYRMGAFGATEGLGRMTPGDDYRRLIPLMEAIPTWMHAASVACGACYLIAAVGLLGRRRPAYIALLLGVGVELVLTLFGRSIVADVGVAAVPDPSFLAAVLLPFVLPLLLAFAAWSGSQRESGLVAVR